MKSGSILNLALDGARSITASPGLCKRERFRKSNCRRCLDFCPEDAITLNPGPIIGGACSECGLCQAACPTEVFQNDLLSEEYLLDRARSLVGTDALDGEKRRLSIRCYRAQAPDERSLSVPCLGAISENIVVGAALIGHEEVSLIRGFCSECRWGQGERLLQSSLQTAAALLEGLGLDEFSVSVRVEEIESKKEATLERRELLSGLAAHAKAYAASALYGKERALRNLLRRDEDGRGRVRVSPKRQVLNEVLRQRGRNRDSTLRSDPGTPWGRMRIDEKQCSGCGTCCVVCPTGAMTTKRQDRYQILNFRIHLCTNCGLCKEACPERVIELEDECMVADLCEDRTRAAARVELTWCRICGETIPAVQGDVCTTCKKRQQRRVVWS